jgi:uncharacterized membrane protein YdjX (TVP38/TMEM64 family)
MQPRRPPLFLRLIPVILVIAGIAAVFWNRDSIDARGIVAGVEAWGALAGVAFVVLHVAGTMVSVPRWALALASGASFGLGGGLFWALAGTLAGASCAFHLARFVNAGAIVPHDLPKIGPWIARAEAGGWRTIALLRLTPIPGALVNYGLGLSSLSWRQFALGTLIGSLPYAAIFVQAGAAGRLAMEDGLDAARDPLLIAGAVGIVVLALSFFVRRKETR